MGNRLAEWVFAAAGRLFGPMFALDAARVGRRLSTFLLRWGYLLGLVGVLAIFVNGWSRRLDTGPGGRVHPTVLTGFAEEFFWVYAVTQFVVVCAVTPAFTAAAVTDEKERKTLDFLLVTDLTGREIVFGKLAARTGALVTFVLAGLPVVSLLQFLGGIEPRLVLFAAAMTLLTVVSLSALSVAASVLMARTREAVVLAYALPAAYLFASAFCYQEAQSLARTDPASRALVVVAEVFAAGNPLVAVERLDRPGAGGGLGGDNVPVVGGWYVGFHAVVALTGFAVASARLRASAWGSVAAKPRGRVRRLVAWVLGRRTEARKHPPVGDDPVRWREVYVDPASGSGVLRRLLAVGVLAAVVFPLLSIISDTLIYPSPSPPWSRPLTPEQQFERFQFQVKTWAVAVTVGLGCLMLLRAAVRGASAIAGERDRDTWLSLLATPLTAREILWGKWAGCVWGQRDAMLLLGCVWAVGVLTGAVNPVMLAFTVAALWLYLTAFAWMGIACSVTARNGRVAVARVMPLVLFAGGGFWFPLFCCGVFVGAGQGMGELLVYAGLFFVGWTPPAALGGLSALEFSYFEWRRPMDPRGVTAITALLGGGIFGTAAWCLLASLCHHRALELFAKETGRSS